MDRGRLTGLQPPPLHPLEGRAEAKDRRCCQSAILGDAIKPWLTGQDGRVEPRPDLRRCPAAKPAHPPDEPIRRPWPSWSTTSTPRLAPPTGDGTAPFILRWPALPRGSRGESTGHVNPKYGSEPGRLSSIPIVFRPVSRAVQHPRGECRRPRFHLCALDGLLYHESADLRIEEHYRHGRLHRSRFAPMHLLGFRRAAHPRPGETKLYRAAGRASLLDAAPADRRHPEHQHVRAHWDDILRPPADQAGHRHRPLDVAQARSYRANGLAVALRELGRVDRAHAVHPGLAAKC